MTKFMITLFGRDQAQNIATRTINGEHWYMAADFNDLLAISNHSIAVHTHLNKNEYRKETIYIGGRRGKKHVLLINTAGVLKLIAATSNEKSRTALSKLRSLPVSCLPDNQQHLLQIIG